MKYLKLKGLFKPIIGIIRINKLALVFPLLFVLLLFIGSKPLKKDQWNDEYLSLDQTKLIKGFCTIGIILHHLSQRTSADWLEGFRIVHGLDFFVDIGYLFVGIFLFYSAYGLYKSHGNNPYYFKDYFFKRILPVLLAYVTTSLIYYLYRGIPSTYTWFIGAIIFCYVSFYLAFSKIKNEHISLLIVFILTCLYIAFCVFNGFGGWVYNTIFLFYVGLLYARYEKYFVKVFKKAYLPLLILFIACCFIFRFNGKYFEAAIWGVSKKSLYNLYSFLIIFYRSLAAIFFAFLTLLITLKVKFNNKILSFYSNISLEFYLIQGLFVQAFSFSYFDAVEPLMHIKNIPLYVVVVLILTTISAYILYLLHKYIIKLISNVITKKQK